MAINSDSDTPIFQVKKLHGTLLCLSSVGVHALICCDGRIELLQLQLC